MGASSAVCGSSELPAWNHCVLQCGMLCGCRPATNKGNPPSAEITGGSVTLIQRGGSRCGIGYPLSKAASNRDGARRNGPCNRRGGSRDRSQFPQPKELVARLPGTD